MTNTTDKYYCDKCNYSTTRKFNYMKHINTDKHVALSLEQLHVNTTSSLLPINQVFYKCQKCERKYTLKRNLWRHMKECSESEPSCINSDAKSTNLNDNHSKTDDSKMMVAMLEYMKSNQTFQEQIIELLRNPKPNVNNTVIQGDFINNQTFNLNVFLNEKCKDAMNMSDFVNSIELSREDMENVGRNGYVNGISRIFIDNLKNTDVHKRPIHCSDRKREVLYVKEHDKWEREGVDSDNLIKAVRTVEQKNIRMINEWAKQHPECEKSETRANDMYMKLSKHGYDGEDENIIKVVKNIAKETVIERKIMIE
jgi:hypothetical protein